MSKGTSRLSLGPIPRPDAVKLTISVSVELKELLDAYAEAHSRMHQSPVDAVTLIPHMLAAFVARDRGFRNGRGRKSAVGDSQESPSGAAERLAPRGDQEGAGAIRQH